MNKTIAREYFRLRKLGMGGIVGQDAKNCLNTAVSNVAWDRLESAGLVRLSIIPDDYYDDSYIDTWDDASESRREQIKKELWEKIERDGVWGIVGEYKIDPESENWEHGDSCFGFIGDEWRDSGYDHSIKELTITALQQALKNRCSMCGK